MGNCCGAGEDETKCVGETVIVSWGKGEYDESLEDIYKYDDDEDADVNHSINDDENRNEKNESNELDKKNTEISNVNEVGGKKSHKSTLVMPTKKVMEEQKNQNTDIDVLASQPSTYDHSSVPSPAPTNQQTKKKDEVVLSQEPFVQTSCPPPPPPIPGMGGPPPPPPMPGMGGPPPPPGMGGLMFLGSSAASNDHETSFSPSKSTETVNIRIGSIPRSRMHKSMFKGGQLFEEGQKLFSDSAKSLLENRFQKKKISQKSDSNKSKTTTPISESLINSQKTLNASIMCSKIRDKVKIIESLKVSEPWLYDTTEGHDTVSRIKQISSFFTQEEKKRIVNNKEELGKKNLNIGDRFILNLFNGVPCLEIKLEILEFLEGCNTVFHKVKPELEKHIKFCKDLKDCEKFRNFIALVLVIANFLNADSSDDEKKNKNKVQVGLSVRTLMNLDRVKNPENVQESLIDVVYMIILNDDPTLLDFRLQFEPVHEIVEQSQLDEKVDHVKSFEDKIKKCQSYLHTLESEQKKGVLSEKEHLISALYKILPGLEKEVEDMNIQVRIAEEHIEEISEHYGHPKESIHEFFIVLKDFLHLLDRTEIKFEKNEKKKKREEMMLQRKKDRELRKKEIEEDKKRRLDMEREKKEKRMLLLNQLEKSSQVQQKNDSSTSIKKKKFFSQKVLTEEKKEPQSPFKKFNMKMKWGMIASLAKKKVENNAVSKWKNLMKNLVDRNEQKKGADGKVNKSNQWKLLKEMMGKK